ncbi:MAG: hypothetical protein AAGI69_28190 [Cyanobacteria bacterium P01_H01_bin.21]
MQGLKRRLRTIAMLMAGILLSLVSGVKAAPIAIPGTSVSLEPPAGFAIAENFAGLENAESGSSITINELPPEAYAEVSTIFSTAESAQEGLLRQGIVVDEHTLITVGQDQVPLLRGVQQTAAGEFTKYLTLLKGETTVLVTFNIADPNQTTQETVEATVASITLAAAPTIEEKIEQLSFSFQTTEPFRVADVLGGSSALLTTFEGTDPSGGGTDPSGMAPMVIIARGQNIIYGQDAADISDDLLRGTRGFSLAEIVRQEAVEFSGGSGYLIEAELDGLAVLQYTYVPANGRYIRLLATGERSALMAVLPAVEEIAASVSLKDQNTGS